MDEDGASEKDPALVLDEDNKSSLVSEVTEDESSAVSSISSSEEKEQILPPTIASYSIIVPSDVAAPSAVLSVASDDEILKAKENFILASSTDSENREDENGHPSTLERPHEDEAILAKGLSLSTFPQVSLPTSPRVSLSPPPPHSVNDDHLSTLDEASSSVHLPSSLPVITLDHDMGDPPSLRDLRSRVASRRARSSRTSERRRRRRITVPGATRVGGISEDDESEEDESITAPTDPVPREEEGYLVSARPVENSQDGNEPAAPSGVRVVEAEEVRRDEKCGGAFRNKHVWVVMALLLVALLALVIGISMMIIARRTQRSEGQQITEGRSVPTESPAEIPIDSPSKGPIVPPPSEGIEIASTQSPTLAKYSRLPMDTIWEILSTVSSEEDLMSERSPQFLSMSWIAYEDKSAIDFTKKGWVDRIIQRHILATFYFAAGGPSWRHQNNFLSDLHECDWQGFHPVTVGVRCQEEEVFKLLLTSNGMNGAIPNELEYLSGLTHLALVGNSLHGTIPKSLANLDNLADLSLTGNNLSGTVPSEIGKMPKLRRLSVGLNSNITGDIGFLCPLSDEFFYLESNCGGSSPDVPCTCCTHCCDEEAYVCCMVDTGDCKLKFEP